MNDIVSIRKIRSGSARILDPFCPMADVDCTAASAAPSWATVLDCFLEGKSLVYQRNGRRRLAMLIES